MVKIRFFDGVVVVHGIVVYNGGALFAPIVRPRCQFVYLNLEVVLKINYCLGAYKQASRINKDIYSLFSLGEIWHFSFFFA